MGLEATDLKRLSSLLDTALDLAPEERAAWLDALPADAQALAPVLRNLLARHASGETLDFIDRPPAFDPPRDDASERPLVAGTPVGPYRLIREIGVGGMGEVWLAERADGSLKRQVALKLPRAAWTRGLAERMARERDILASLEHPHIARLYDAGSDAQGRPYLALEYVEGQPIDVYARQRSLSLEARLALLLQVAHAVAFAHSRLVVHRDLKPGNILVGADGEVRLLDFGIAKLMEGERAAETQLTLMAGRALTLDYASPEQIRGEPIGTASDVYSLGVVAYELLAGARPYKLKRGSAAELEEAIAAIDAPLASAVTMNARLRKELKGDLDAILNKALKKDPGERYASVEAFAQDIERHLRGQPVLARPDRASYRLRKFVARNKLAVSATAVVTLALMIGAGVALWQAAVAKREAKTSAAVQRFVLDMFRNNASRQKDPAKARATTARELLDLGAEQLDKSLQDAPDARLRMLRTLGEMYYQLELDEQAAAIDEKVVQMLRDAGVRNDVRLADALVRLASSLHGTSRRDQILPALEEARAILDAAGERTSERRGGLLVRLAQRHFNLSLATSAAYAEEAAAVFRSQRVVDKDMVSTALILGARARIAMGEPTTAARLYREAIALLLELPNRPHFDVMQARIGLAESLLLMQDAGQALVLSREAVEAGAAALGKDAPGVLVVQARAAAIAHAVGQRAAARGLLQQALEAVLRQKGEDTLYTPAVRTQVARSLNAEGRLQEAGELSDAVVRTNRRHYAGSAILGGNLQLAASIAWARGEHAEARQLLEEAADLLHRGSGGALRPWRFNPLVLDAARIELAEGKPDAALDQLARFKPWPDEESPVPRPDDLERLALAAEAQLQRGDLQAAQASAKAAVDGAATVAARGRRPGAEADAALAYGMVLLQSRQPHAALPHLERALAIRREFDDPTSPRIAQAEALHGQALLGAGERKAAQEAAARAKAIVKSHPALSPAFTRPVATLEASLGS